MRTNQLEILDLGRGGIEEARLEDYAVIRMAYPFVNFWKVGKLNHMKAYERTVDWSKFLIDAETLLTKLGAKYYIKNDLRSFAMKQ